MCADSRKKLELLTSKFLSCLPVKYINWQDFHNFSWDDQFDLLRHTILHPLNESHPIKSTYQLSFMKCLIETLEKSGCEVHDLVYESFCNLQSGTGDPENFTYKHYSVRSRGLFVTLKESKTFISNGTTGLCSWQASLALSEWLLKNPELTADKVVLELGAGTGLSGIVAARCCQTKKVTVSDGSPVVVKLLSENVEMNCGKGQTGVETAMLRWEQVDESDLSKEVIPDVLLGADLVYDNAVFPALSKALESIFGMAENACVMYLAATVRNEETLQEFLTLLESKKFNASEEKYVSPSNDLFWDESTPIKIFSISRK